MRIGIFGGTFDPPHIGHLLAAGDALEALALDRVVFIPVAQQPLKAGQTTAPGPHRLAMVRALAGDDPRFGVDDVEIERGGLSFTVDTLRALRERWRDDERLALFLLLGSDAAATLPNWREREAVAALAEIVVLWRGDGGPGEGEGQTVGRTISTRRVDISSTEVRNRVRAGRSIRGFVPDAVAAYIESAALYR
jgi:nicotinate-nucleotide adenylyltransferase